MSDTAKPHQGFNPDIHVPGLWRCAKCNFVLVQSNLNAVDGSITARDEAGDKCPNDGAPLWRVSWKEHATEMSARAEELLARAVGAEAKERELADLTAKYYRREIGRLMQQAEHWARENFPLAVHHRVRVADAYFQIVALCERFAQWNENPFQKMRDELARDPVYPAGDYPPTAELNAYREPAFVVEKLKFASKAAGGSGVGSSG